MSSPQLKMRQSLRELQNQYESGNRAPLENLMRAWKGIKELPADNPHSFFRLGGYHGEPFRGAGWGNSIYWGGYCNHGNVLFPVWHRVYLLKLEEALQSIEGCESVMLPYWDETSEESRQNGIPRALTDEYFQLDGETIPNPLRSFILPKKITDNINGDNPNYSKPERYETVRYPLSGLVGTEEEQQRTNEHNAQFSNPAENVVYLNRNIIQWLNSHITVDGKIIPTNVVQKYIDCLHAPNYTVFSNTTSAQEWNNNLENGLNIVVPLESPHNSIHLAVGGFDVPNEGDYSPIPGANGDMGENDTAALDPIFYFHHCNVDRVFWLWQLQHGAENHLEIIPEYPGTNTVDSQGPTPGMVPNTWLTLESPLNPFKRQLPDGPEVPYTAHDCINIEQQLGYTYSTGSLAGPAQPRALQEGESAKMVRISKINRAPIRGSFIISAYVNLEGKRHCVGREAILSRWSVQYCANCQTHLEVKAFFGLQGFDENLLKNATYDVEIQGRDGRLTGDSENLSLPKSQKLFHLEIH